MTDIERDRLILATARAVLRLMEAHSGAPPLWHGYSQTDYRTAQLELADALRVRALRIKGKRR